MWHSPILIDCENRIMKDRRIRSMAKYAALASCVVFGTNVLPQAAPAVTGSAVEPCRLGSITCWSQLADKAHQASDIDKESQFRQVVSQLAWDNWERHPKSPGRWNRWAIVYENDLPLARLLEGTHLWLEAEAIYRHNQSMLEHERLAGNDIKSENDLELAHLLTKEGKQPEAKALCGTWKNRVKHNADFALYALKYDVPTPPLYDTPEVEVAVWKLECERPEDGLSLLEEQIYAHPGMLAPFAAMVNYYTSEGNFRIALTIEKNGTSALLSTPNEARK
jgi:hypothetical protein